jgi:hypothetical protein
MTKHYKEQITLVGLISLGIKSDLSVYKKQWNLFKIVKQMNNQNDHEQSILIKNNPTFTNQDLVLQPQTLDYGLYRFYFSVTFKSNSLTNINMSTLNLDTFLSIIPSGLVLSTLKLSQPMFGGTIEITRGTNQSIDFDPFLFTYDIDSKAVITSLSFKYSCQIVNDQGETIGLVNDSNTNITYLDTITIKQQKSANPMTKTCFRIRMVSLFYRGIFLNRLELKSFLSCLKLKKVSIISFKILYLNSKRNFFRPVKRLAKLLKYFSSTLSR